MRFELSMTRLFPAVLWGAVAWSCLPFSASAQFGRNKVQFDDFDFRVLETEHFDWHFYPEEADAGFSYSIDDLPTGASGSGWRRGSFASPKNFNPCPWRRNFLFSRSFLRILTLGPRVLT